LRVAAGAYTNLVKLQMQQQEADVGQQAEVEEVLASDGKPVSRQSLDRVVSRCVDGTDVSILASSTSSLGQTPFAHSAV
jgi:hypothetical protein